MIERASMAAARRRWALASAVVLVLSGALAACGDLPRPFQPAEKSTKAWSAPGDIAWGSILVPPIAGLPPLQSAALADEVVEALQVRDVPRASTRAGGRGSIVLAGQVAVVSGKLRWTLVTPDGETALRFEESLLDAARLDETAPHLAAIAARAARRIAAALEPPAADDGVARTASPVVLEGVRGAPGDGGIALARAMRHSLARIGIAVADYKDGEARLISGRVSVLRDDTASDDATVTIAWDVLRPDGKRLGTVTQSNRVSVERLTGAWGALARIVARAGAPGIAQLLVQTEASRVAEAPRRWTPSELPFRTPAEASPPPTRQATEALPPPAIASPIERAHRARGRSAFRAIHADYRGAGCAGPNRPPRQRPRRCSGRCPRRRPSRGPRRRSRSRSWSP